MFAAIARHRPQIPGAFCGPGQGVTVIGQTSMQVLQRLQKLGRVLNGSATWRSWPRPTNPRDFDCQTSSQTRTHRPQRTQFVLRMG